MTAAVFCFTYLLLRLLLLVQVSTSTPDFTSDVFRCLPNTTDIGTGVHKTIEHVDGLKKCIIACVSDDSCLSAIYTDTDDLCDLSSHGFGSGILSAGKTMCSTVKCEEGWVYNPHRDTCLHLETEAKNTADARAACQTLNSGLAILDSLESRQWILDLRAAHSDWIGQSLMIFGASKNALTGQWEWDNGSTDQMDYDFAVDNSGDCLQMWEGGIRFDDFDCAALASFVCEKAAYI